MVGTVRTEIDADLEAGLGTLEIRLVDPNGTSGISPFAILWQPLDVASITDPLFSATFELRDASGGLAATINLERIEGIRYVPSICTVVPNSTGSPTRLYTRGSPLITNNDLVIGAADLPPSSFVFFLTSKTPAFFQNIPNSAGNLCVGGSIGRFVGPGQILATGTGGPVELPIDLTALPQPMGPVAAVPGETWYFTCWYRDVVGTTASNFGSTGEITFF